MTKRNHALIFLRGALGDCLMTLPFLAGLASHWRGDGLNLVGDANVLRLMANQAFISGIYSQDSAGWAGLYAIPPQRPPELESFVRQHQCAAVMTRRFDDPIADSLAALGLEVMTFPSRPPEDRRIHLVDHIFSATGVPRPDVAPLLCPTDEGLHWADRAVADMGLRPGGYLAIHPGSGSESKNYPIELWLETACQVEKDLDNPAVFILGPADMKLKGILKNEGVRLVEGLNLNQLAGFLSQAAVYAGCDSGVSHLAAGLGAPTVAVFGPTDPACWAPQGPRVRVIWDGGVWPDPDKVVDAIKKLFRQAD
jgi:heptosyltransferase-3